VLVSLAGCGQQGNIMDKDIYVFGVTFTIILLTLALILIPECVMVAMIGAIGTMLVNKWVSKKD
jgi:hypothetical protein